MHTCHCRDRRDPRTQTHADMQPQSSPPNLFPVQWNRTARVGGVAHAQKSSLPSPSPAPVVTTCPFFFGLFGTENHQSCERDQGEERKRQKNENDNSKEGRSMEEEQDGQDVGPGREKAGGSTTSVMGRLRRQTLSLLSPPDDIAELRGSAIARVQAEQEADPPERSGALFKEGPYPNLIQHLLIYFFSEITISHQYYIIGKMHQIMLCFYFCLLFQKGGKWKKWKERWFTLKKAVLSYKSSLGVRIHPSCTAPRTHARAYETCACTCDTLCASQWHDGAQ